MGYSKYVNKIGYSGGELVEAEVQELPNEESNLNVSYNINDIKNSSNYYRKTRKTGAMFDLVSRMLPCYSNSFAVQTYNVNELSIVNGIVLFRITSDNDTFVKNAINLTGYKVYEIISDFSKLQLFDTSYWRSLSKTLNYNTIKFDYIDVYGWFPDNIAKQLDSILSNGVRVWYTGTNFGKDDSYVS